MFLIGKKGKITENALRASPFTKISLLENNSRKKCPEGKLKSALNDLGEYQQGKVPRRRHTESLKVRRKGKEKRDPR